MSVALPFMPAKENVLTGVVLLGFALGWALLAVLSVRFSDQPQRWAAAPAAFMAAGRSRCLSGSAAVQRRVRLGVAAGLARPRRLDVLSGPSAASQPRRTVAAVPGPGRVGGWPRCGGGYETVRESLDARAYPMPGQLVDVGGHRLHLHCTGTGSPTVILEPGQGGGLLRLRVDRAGRGPRHHGLRLRPRRSRLERRRRRPAGR